MHDGNYLIFSMIYIIYHDIEYIYDSNKYHDNYDTKAPVEQFPIEI